jgi:hypothetical protein
MPKKYMVKLKSNERKQWLELVPKGKGSAPVLTQARILLKADPTGGQSGWTEEALGEAFDLSVATVERVRPRYARPGLVAAVKRRSRAPARARRLDGKPEAHWIALAGREAPPGHEPWTWRLLADRRVEREEVAEFSPETVRQTRTPAPPAPRTPRGARAVPGKKRTQTLVEKRRGPSTPSPGPLWGANGSRAGAV